MSGLGAVGMLKADKDGSQQLQARAFNLAEITTITHNFVRKLGQGSFGPVFYGKLPDGTEVAVKVNAADSSQGTEEFVNEVSHNIVHPHSMGFVGRMLYRLDRFRVLCLSLPNCCWRKPLSFLGPLI